MTPIIYKGKRKDNGQWIEGYIIQVFSKTYITTSIELKCTMDIDETLHNCSLWEVVPETVCLYVGDKRPDGSVGLWINIRQLLKSYSNK